MLAKLKLYKSLVVTVLKYASPVWSPHTKKDTQKLELVQRHVTLKANLDMEYETQLCVLGLVSLEECRRIKDLVTCYMVSLMHVDVHYFTPGLCLTRSRSYRFSSATLTVLSSLLLIELCLHGIAFLILLFLLRVLSYLENVCLCITV